MERPTDTDSKADAEATDSSAAVEPAEAHADALSGKPAEADADALAGKPAEADTDAVAAEAETSEADSSLDEIVFPPGWEPGAPLPDDFVDELLADDDDLLGRRADFSIPLLVGLVALFALWLAAQYTLELRYAFSPADPLVLGQAEELQLDPELRGPNGLVLPSNRHVHLESILERRAQSDDNAFYKVVGAPIIVHRIERDDTPRILRNAPRIPTRVDERDVQPMHRGSGRLVAFEDLSERYRGIASYYSQLLAVEYCSVEPGLQLQRFLENRRERVRLRLEEELGREATPEELLARQGRLARCERGYMFFVDQTPASMWYFPALYLIFLLMLLGCGVVLVRWLRTVLGREGADDSPTQR